MATQSISVFREKLPKPIAQEEDIINELRRLLPYRLDRLDDLLNAGIAVVHITTLFSNLIDIRGFHHAFFTLGLQTLALIFFQCNTRDLSPVLTPLVAPERRVSKRETSMEVFMMEAARAIDLEGEARVEVLNPEGLFGLHHDSIRTAYAARLAALVPSNPYSVLWASISGPHLRHALRAFVTESDDIDYGHELEEAGDGNETSLGHTRKKIMLDLKLDGIFGCGLGKGVTSGVEGKQKSETEQDGNERQVGKKTSYIVQGDGDASPAHKRRKPKPIGACEECSVPARCTISKWPAVVPQCASPSHLLRVFGLKTALPSTRSACRRCIRVWIKTTDRLHSARARYQYTLLDFECPRSWFGERGETNTRGGKARTRLGFDEVRLRDLPRGGFAVPAFFDGHSQESVGLARSRVQRMMTALVFARARQDAGGSSAEERWSALMHRGVTDLFIFEIGIISSTSSPGRQRAIAIAELDYFTDNGSSWDQILDQVTGASEDHAHTTTVKSDLGNRLQAVRSYLVHP
ncbi:hypothetical protein HD554DRAFT_2035044 [Boletus coccyginus]|nr:hypothetical protein HD554DRAFT_2035044 [Boletus coccyginus]